MRFASLGSGSSGNATLICSGNTRVLVDCGFGVKETARRLDNFGLLPEQLDAILVTHEHSDHVKGVGAFSRRYNTPVFMTSGTYRARDYGELHSLTLVEDYACFNIGDFNIEPVAVPHDACEPAQYIFSTSQACLGVLTDLGCITPHVELAYQKCDALLLEANHCSEMLAYGHYPPSLKARVAGGWGHLNNQQTLQFLENFDLTKLRHLVIGHISRHNNSVAKVVQTLAALDSQLSHIDVVYACQDEGFPWQEILASSSTEKTSARVIV